MYQTPDVNFLPYRNDVVEYPRIYKIMILETANDDYGVMLSNNNASGDWIITNCEATDEFNIKMVGNEMEVFNLNNNQKRIVIDILADIAASIGW